MNTPNPKTNTMTVEHTGFFYGTLMAPEVFFRVCYGMSQPRDVLTKLHKSKPATLHDHCRHRVQHADYPGVIPEKGKSVKGVIITGINEANLVKLDAFEGSDYVRRRVEVEVDGKMQEVLTYIFENEEDLDRREWDYEEFRRDKLQYWASGDWAFDQDPEDRATVDGDASRNAPQ